MTTTHESPSKNEVIQQSVQERAKGIVGKLGQFITGEHSYFSAIFILNGGDIDTNQDQQKLELEFAQLLELSDTQLESSTYPVRIMKIADDITLLRWVHIQEDSVYEVYYQAVRGDQDPSMFAEW